MRKSKTLVAIFLRGGMDGLNFIVPFKDPGYYKARRNIAMPEPGKDGGVVDLDGFFGLHPRAAALAPLFQKGQAVALQAVGYSLNTRSHFEEQDTWETGVSGNTLSSDGWLNRHLLTSQGHGPIRAVSIGDTLPRILRGKAPAFSVRGITDLGLFPENMKGGFASADHAKVFAALEHAYCCDPRVARAAAEAHATPPGFANDAQDARDLLAATAHTTFDGMKELKAITSRPYTPAAKYPDSDFGRKLEQVARPHQVGHRPGGCGGGLRQLGHAPEPGRHTDSGGNYGKLVGGLADGLAAFAADLENHLDDVLVLTLSDFGARGRERHQRHGPRLGELHVRDGRSGAGGEPQRAAPRPRALAGPAARAAPREARPAAHDGFPRRAGRDRLHAPGQREHQDGAALARFPAGRAGVEAAHSDPPR